MRPSAIHTDEVEDGRQTKKQKTSSSDFVGHPFTSIPDEDFLLAQFDAWKVTHIHREGNSPADLLASYQSVRGETIIKPSQIWHDLAEAMKKDMHPEGFKRVK
ncbi:hypothetical protein QJS10_CPA10g00740 [Acorus calamus]|uniref:RNase H type-1 domain-containing protein n=1 Tax=Acorus calamus TaxID=4465 RepID=A0AAV9E1I6_ACOCL|nr:hypothetical protein QJS10_CPA10g00740 [Acorus calamus]